MCRSKTGNDIFQSVQKDTELFELIYSDMCDIKFTSARSDNKYFETFTDDITKYCYIFLLKSKDEADDKFDIYKFKVENNRKKKIKRLGSDQSSEDVASFWPTV